MFCLNQSEMAVWSSGLRLGFPCSSSGKAGPWLGGHIALIRMGCWTSVGGSVGLRTLLGPGVAFLGIGSSTAAIRIVVARLWVLVCVVSERAVAIPVLPIAGWGSVV